MVVERLVDALTALGHVPEVRGADALVDVLTELSGELGDRRAGATTTPIYFVAFGMDRSPNLRVPDPATFTQPIDALHVLWREGSPLGVHVLGWWGNARSYSDQLGMEAQGMVDVLALLRIGNQDVIDMLGPFVSWNAPTNRALVRDVAEAGGPSTIVPFAGLTEHDVSELARARSSS